MDNVDAPGLDTWQEQELGWGKGKGFGWEKVNRVSKPSRRLPTPSNSQLLLLTFPSSFPKE